MITVKQALAMFRPVQCRALGNDAKGRIRRGRFALVLGLTLVAGCDRRAETGREMLDRWEHEASLAAVMELRPCRGLPAPAPEWPRHAQRFFVLQAPPEYRYEALQGIDSYVGRFHGPGRELGFDYGAYSSSLQEWREEADYRACRVAIDGHPVKVVTARSPRGGYVAAAAWRELGPDRQTHLTISGTSDSPVGQRELLAIFRSVRLTPPGRPR